MVIKPIHIRLAIAGGVVLFVLVVLSVAIWLLCSGQEQRQAQAAVTKVIEKEAEPEEVFEVMTTVSFEKLSPGQVDQLAAKMREMRKTGQRPPMQRGELTQAQRQQMHKNMRFMMRRMMQARIDEFSKLNTDEERNAYLDKQIDDMEKNRPQGPPPDRGNKDGDNKDRGPGGPGGSHEAHMAHHKTMMDTSSSVERAQFSNYMHALHKRMEARGIKGPGRH